MMDVKGTTAGCRASERVAKMFSGELTASEAEALALQNVGEPERQECLEAFQALADVDRLTGDSELLALAEQPAPVSGGSTYWPKLSVAAAIVLSIGVVLTALFDGQPASDIGDIKRYVTRVGEQRTVALEDGSMVTLNTGSEVLVDYSDERRQLVLNRGEAFFDVAKDESRPFSVVVESKSVTAWGTTFNIRKKPGAFTLSVVDGLVAVHDKIDVASSEALVLDPPSVGDAVTIDKPGQCLIGAGVISNFDLQQNCLFVSRVKNMEDKLRWRTGMLRFEDKPLSEVVKELNRYSPKKILIEDSSVMGLKVYAAFKIGRINMALTDLEKTMPIRVMKYFDRTIIEAKP